MIAIDCLQRAVCERLREMWDALEPERSPTELAAEGFPVTDSPYKGLPPERYWRTGVAEQHPTSIQGLYRKRFEIAKTDKIATAGSCFAQHIARHLRQRGCNVLDREPAPPGLDGEAAKAFGYNLYSARYGNVYTIRQLLQLVQEASGKIEPADAVWEREGRFFDALRPSVEPDGHATAEIVRQHRKEHLAQVKLLFERADLLIFTFGLTESWRHKASGTIYPTAPGTIAGRFDPEVYEFVNFTVHETLQDFSKLRNFLKRRNPSLRFLITVSPVPLTATATNQHILSATTYSKSVLRAACGQLYSEYEDIDYFPSYEVIASPFSRGFFFEQNMRSVTDAGVDTVMRVFFSEHKNLSPPSSGQAGGVATGRPRRARKDGVEPRQKGAKKEDVVCEEALLEAFAR